MASERRKTTRDEAGAEASNEREPGASGIGARGPGARAIAAREPTAQATAPRERTRRVRRDGLRHGATLVGLGIACGLLWSTSPPPFDQSALYFAGTPFLLVALERARTAGQGALAGFAAGFATNVVVLGWVVGLLEVFAHFPLALALPVGALLWAAQSLPFAAAGAGVVALARAGEALAPGRLRALTAPWLTLPVAVAVGTAITPALFPWHVSTSQLGFLPYVQLVEVGGLTLVDVPLVATSTAAVALLRAIASGGAVGAACAAATASPRAATGRAPGASVRLRSARTPAIVFAAAAVAPPLYGAVRIAQVETERRAAPVVRVGVVQPNIGIEEKHSPTLWSAHLRALHEASVRLERAGAELVVWPETAYPYRLLRGLAQEPPGRHGPRGGVLRGPLLFGAITESEERGPAGPERFNSVLVAGSGGGLLGIADKVELLAFGEYVPFWDVLPPLRRFFPRRGLTPGVAPRVLDAEVARVGVLNCYEDVLSEYARRVVASAPTPDFLVNVTNDAWFGDTAEPALHNAVARFRAIETRRDLVRAVNTGISSHVTATGALRVATGTFVPAEFVADVAVLRGTTPWTALGDWTSVVLGAYLAALAIAARVGGRAGRT
jgi:apolipoprotein N-acyltransferase